MRRAGKRGRLVASVIAVAAVAALALTGCTANDDLAKQYAAGSGKNYISGSGVTETSPHKREVVDFSGTSEDGTTISSKAMRGDVIVVNFWYAGCGPCRAEASDLQKASTSFDGKDVSFVGVNTRDSAATAKTFDSRFKVTYPSILDVDGGGVQLAFSGSMRPNATPTTFVVDKQGRIAARIDGPISDQPSTLTTLISSTLAEGS